MSDNYGVQIERLAAQFEESKRVNEELRASNAALKAELEETLSTVTLLSGERAALKQEVEGLTARLTDVRENWTIEATGLRSQLKRYASWQPSDPGTKEAMERSEPNCPTHGLETIDGCADCYALVLSTALRAAMVRLEEAEKKLEDAMNNRHCVHSERAQKAEALVACKEYSESLLAQRAEAAESRVAALTASLAGLRKKMGGI